MVDESRARQHMTVEKPANGLKNDHLQKSATTHANTTVHAASFAGNEFTPCEKQAKFADASDMDDYSDKFTPENAIRRSGNIAQRRAQKLQSKEAIQSLKQISLQPQSPACGSGADDGAASKSQPGGGALALRLTRHRTSQQLSLIHI